MNRADVYRELPPLFLAWFQLILGPALRSGNNRHNEREARTIVEVCDTLLRGDTLGALVILIGRLRALTSIIIPEGAAGGWSVAQHFEVLQTSSSGLLTQRDRAKGLRDQRDSLRAQALPPRGRGRGGDHDPS